MSEIIPIWRIKYLPQKLEEICGRKDIIKNLKNIIKKRNFPHLLLVGSEGIGKTTIARLFSKEFLGRYFAANYKLIYAECCLNKDDAYRRERYLKTTMGKRYLRNRQKGGLTG